MASRRLARREAATNYWPGFVDAMATLLLAIIFLLSVFILSQFFLTQEITGKDAVLNRLNGQIAELTQLLALERSESRDLKDSLTTLQTALSEAEGAKTRLLSLLEGESSESESAAAAVAALSDEVADEKKLSQKALSQVEFLNRQILALRQQITALEGLLEAAESKDKKNQTAIANLGRQLNVALAQRVQQLNRYRSDFFGRLRQILGSRSDIRVVGDRFVFQSEVLFSSGADTINEAGQDEMNKLAEALLELEKEIPKEINWVIRVDGHTDARPLSGSGRYRNNWELSAARAISVVRYLITQGVPPNRLVAAGFGEFQPLVDEENQVAYDKNRRIELKLTEK